jgi:hypothetical protein
MIPAYTGLIEADLGYATSVAVIPYISRLLAAGMDFAEKKLRKRGNEKLAEKVQTWKTNLGLYFPIVADFALTVGAWVGYYTGYMHNPWFTTTVAGAPYVFEGAGVFYDFKEMRAKEEIAIYKQMKKIPIRVNFGRKRESHTRPLITTYK